MLRSNDQGVEAAKWCRRVVGPGLGRAIIVVLREEGRGSGGRVGGGVRVVGVGVGARDGRRAGGARRRRSGDGRLVGVVTECMGREGRR